MAAQDSEVRFIETIEKTTNDCRTAAEAFKCLTKENLFVDINVARNRLGIAEHSLSEASDSVRWLTDSEMADATKKAVCDKLCTGLDSLDGLWKAVHSQTVLVLPDDYSRRVVYDNLEFFQKETEALSSRIPAGFLTGEVKNSLASVSNTYKQLEGLRN